MAQLAIKGHSTRGKEVIQLLEMLGGHNSSNLFGYGSKSGYFITDSGDIGSREINYILSYFTLEEFLEKYPYKVGDRVSYRSDKLLETQVITHMRWDSNYDCVLYYLDNCNIITVDDILYKIGSPEDNIPTIQDKTTVETMEDKDMSEQTSEINLNHPCFDGHDKIELIIPVNWKFEQIDNKMFGIRKYPQYPTTYGECCDILGYDPSEDEINCYKGGLIESFVRLLICRNAYWKIAGEQMGLDKPWEPDWGENDGGYRYCIRNRSNKIVLSNEWLGENYILSFPTAEMQDEFYKNFKDLINKVKELL